ncbi:histidine phosphatase family protein [Oceanidesulfovibrio marinus]|uniref:phosphoglycerate mutase (2,3-diphosphoglycerate-dependent) n=1 Tax=Oceanidesulfovibrio marinus TaxID=370038 RepID=A0A6P1ZG78_9BACT|nr:histidine phosphatase family protein [Oceanidesulfovibrio marinus]TVM33811.1 histidine phosphatase family protein [Oceanidesulfovibrio marinus]
MGELCLMRHGRVEMFHIKRFLGRTDAPLDERGRQQARWWGERLGPDQFETVWCSELSRSRETAALVACGGAVTPVPELSEIDLGEWDGLPMAELKQRDLAAFEARGKDLAGFRPPGGESFADLARRVVPALENILALAADSERDHLVVGHLGVNRVFLAHVLAMEVGSIMRIEQDYACMNRIRPGKREPRLVSMNITPELLGLAAES